MFKNTPLTKRQLGILFTLGGLIGFIGVFAIDLVDVGREGGIGPAQQIALVGCLLLAVVGLSLIPLGEPPA